MSEQKESKHKVFANSDDEEEEEVEAVKENVKSTVAKDVADDGTSAVKKQRRACKFFLLGRCTKGDACEYSHEVTKDSQIPVCWYVRNKKECTNEHCPFSHDLKRIYCKHYLRGTCWKGDQCPFSHDCPTNAEREAHKKEKRREHHKKQAAAKKRYLHEHPEAANKKRKLDSTSSD